MRFRAVRPSQLGKVDAIIIPLFVGGEPPTWLSRTTRAAVARLVKEEHGVNRLYGVNTLHEDPRVVVVGGGKREQLDAERARNIASAGVRALWRSSVRKVAIAIGGESLGEERAAQAAVEGAIYAMWRPEVHRTREDERRLPNIDQVLLVTEKAVGDAIERGSASLASRARFSSSFAIFASEVTATAIISRPSSVLPMEKTLTRGLACSSIRM